METYNWDVIYACSGDYINAQLAANPSEYIQGFTYEDSAISMTGAFGAWQLVAGGSGMLLQFVTPLKTGSLTIKQNQQVISLDGAVPLVQMQLALQKGANQSITHQLVFNCTSVGQKGDTTPGVVAVIDPDTSGQLAKETNGAMAAALLVAGLGNCFVQNANQLSYVFADVLPVPTGQNSDWLTPQAIAYGYQQPINNTLGGLAILGLLNGTDTSSLPRYFDYSLLTGYDFGFVLGAGPFLQNVIIPGLPGAFGGNCTTGDFALAGNTITMSNGFNLNDVQVGAISYTPEVTGFQFNISDTSMQCYMGTNTDITGLTDAYVTNSVTSDNQSTFDVGSRTLSFLPDPNQSTTQDKHIPWWEEVLGVLTVGIMNVVIDAISLAIENAVGDSVATKTAQALGNVAPGLVTWKGQSAVNITAGGLADNVFMQGNLN